MFWSYIVEKSTGVKRVKPRRTSKLATRGSHLVAKKKPKKVLKTKCSTIELSDTRSMVIPDSPPETNMELPSNFLRDSADRDAAEAEEKYQQLKRVSSVIIDTQKFLIKLSNKGIKYVDVVRYLETNRDFIACNTENEASRVRSLLTRIFEGDEKSMYEGLSLFSKKMETKRKAIREGKRKEIPARYKKMCKQLRQISGMGHRDDAYKKHTTELSWINKNREEFERIIELKMSKHSEVEVAKLMDEKPGKIGRIISAARAIEWISGNASNLVLEHPYFKMFHPDGNIASMNENIRIFYRH